MDPRARKPWVARSTRRFRPLLAALLVAACSAVTPSDTPGGVLVGSWGNGDAGLTAGRGGATLSLPCIGARFSALKLDDSLGFRGTGVVTDAGGVVSVQPGDPYTLTGQLVGDRVVIPLLGPGADTLQSGTDTVHVCNF